MSRHKLSKTKEPRRGGGMVTIDDRLWPKASARQRRAIRREGARYDRAYRRWKRIAYPDGTSPATRAAFQKVLDSAEWRWPPTQFSDRVTPGGVALVYATGMPADMPEWQYPYLPGLQVVE